MSDITKCTGEGCMRKTMCYRFTAKPHEYRQSYFSFVPVEKDGKCKHFWQNTPEEQRDSPDEETIPWDEQR